MAKNRIIKPLEIPLDLPLTISQNFGPTSVEADQFFVAYNAVVTLAYRPFSRTLLEIKSLIEHLVGDSPLED